MMKYLFPIFLFFFYIDYYAQQMDNFSSVINGDTLKITQQDTLTISDTTKLKKKFDVDAVVYASSADSLLFDVSNKKMYLHGKSELKYKDSELKSAKIFIDYDKNELEAFGIEDNSDTAKIKIKDTPQLTEGSQTYEGARLRYNLKTKQGFISAAKNKEQDQRYEGEKVKKVDKDTYFIDKGMFTTCQSDTPHTYFSANEMKVIQKDKIVARWVFMHVGGVPIPIPLPFAVIPNESGRRSGIIIPTYGLEANRGQYFRNFGYFFAINNYMDYTLTGDYYTKGGYGFRSRYRYAKRYNYSGNFNAGYSKILIGEKDDPKREEQTDWNLSWYHNQQINPTMRLDVNLQFLSSNFLSNNSISYNDLLSKDIVSNATFSKIWDESGNSLSINYSRTQNLEKGDIYESLPNINFSKSFAYPFKREGTEQLSDQKWYELLGYSYSLQFSNSRRKTSGKLDIRAGALHTLSMNISPKVGYFSISPRIGYSEKWYNKRLYKESKSIEMIDPKTGIKTTQDTTIESSIHELNFVRTFDMNVSASTKLYGIFNPNVFGIESFRHTMLPSVSYNYQPDFSSDAWGYYDSYKKPNGEIVRYSKYEREIFGGVSSGQSQSLNFSLGNIFEIKMAKSPSDTTREQTKIQLLNIDANLGYNFAADSLKLSDLFLSYRTQIGDLLNFYSSSVFTFYDFAEINRNGIISYERINQFLAAKGKGLFRLTSFSFSISTILSGEKIKSAPDAKKREQIDDASAFKKKDYISLYDDTETPDLDIPWNLSLSYSFNLSKPTPNQVNKSSNLNADLNFSLTKNWKFVMRGSYDFQTKQIAAPQISIFRDLHCWEMNFVWNPLGSYRGFRFEIRMKAPELQDIKVTKSGGLYSGRR